MNKVTVPPGKIILKHGGYNRRLFLINKGEVAIYHTKHDKKDFVAQFGRGNLLGEFSFTSISLCSATVVSKTEIELMILDSAVADSWHDKQPALYEKVIRFCERNGKVDDIISKKKLKKRKHSRYEIKGGEFAPHHSLKMERKPLAYLRQQCQIFL